MTQITATYIDHMGSDLSVVNAARVSFGKKTDWEYHDSQTMRLAERDAKLIKYLAKHRHISPFGHCFVSFHIKAPIFVARQLVKHKFLRWNEISRRYVDDEPEFYTPDVWRGRSADKKQGSEGVVELPWNLYEDNYEGAFGDLEGVNYDFKQVTNVAFESYKNMIDLGVAPEQARMILPQSTMTEWYWSGSLDAFASMCRLRLPSDTQQETRVVAQQIDTVMSDLFPVSWAALMSNS